MPKCEQHIHTLSSKPAEMNHVPKGLSLSKDYSWNGMISLD